MLDVHPSELPLPFAPELLVPLIVAWRATDDKLPRTTRAQRALDDLRGHGIIAFDDSASLLRSIEYLQEAAQNDGPKTKKWHQIVTVRRRAARGADDQRSSNMVNKG